MKTSPIKSDGEVKSREDYVHEKQMYESAKQSHTNAKVLENMLASILK